MSKYLCTGAQLTFLHSYVVVTNISHTGVVLAFIVDTAVSR